MVIPKLGKATDKLVCIQCKKTCAEQEDNIMDCNVGACPYKKIVLEVIETSGDDSE